MPFWKTRLYITRASTHIFCLGLKTIQFLPVWSYGPRWYIEQHLKTSGKSKKLKKIKINWNLYEICHFENWIQIFLSRSENTAASSSLVALPSLICRTASEDFRQAEKVKKNKVDLKIHEICHFENWIHYFLSRSKNTAASPSLVVLPSLIYRTASEDFQQAEKLKKIKIDWNLYEICHFEN